MAEEGHAIQRLRAWLATAGADAAYLTSPATVRYLSGVEVNPLERLMALVVRPDQAVLVLPAIEREKAEAVVRDATVWAWRDGEDPYDLVGAAVGGAGRLAVEKRNLSLEAAETLVARLGIAEMADAGPELRRLRRVKSTAEIRLLEEAARITDAVTEGVLARVRPGMSEVEIARMIDGMIEAAGSRPSFSTIVLSGPNSALPHGVPGPRLLEAGDLLLLDFGAAYEGYCADTTRMAVIGEPSAEQVEMHDLVARAQEAGVAAVRAGATAGEVDAAARTVIAEGGHGELFIHRAGHGLGLEAHEDPSLDPGSSLVLEAGMTVTVEPGVYLGGWGGIRIEDDVVVEPGGGRRLTSAGRSLVVIPAG